MRYPARVRVTLRENTSWSVTVRYSDPKGLGILVHRVDLSGTYTRQDARAFGWELVPPDQRPPGARKGIGLDP